MQANLHILIGIVNQKYQIRGRVLKLMKFVSIQLSVSVIKIALWKGSSFFTGVLNKVLEFLSVSFLPVIHGGRHRYDSY